MADERINKLAKILVDYSLQIKKGDLFVISGNIMARPLITEVYELALQRGAHPSVRVTWDELTYSFYKNAGNHQLQYLSPILKNEVEKITAYLNIWAEENTRNCATTDSAKQALHQKSLMPFYKRFHKRSASGELRWCGTLFPTPGLAQEADLPLREYEDFVYNAAKVHEPDPVAAWKKISRQQERIIRILSSFRNFHIQTPHADLTFSVDNTRKWINCDGKENFPDGEIFISPLENSVEGRVYFTYPAIFKGREVSGVELTFQKGKVTQATAQKNEAFLHSMLDTDKGARYVGEIAVGMNYEIDRFSRNILFDEKIGGTFHLAVGKSLEESGGKNQSAIHWDMISSLKTGTITADKKIIYKDGEFLNLK